MTVGEVPEPLGSWSSQIEKSMAAKVGPTPRIMLKRVAEKRTWHIFERDRFCFLDRFNFKALIISSKSEPPLTSRLGGFCAQREMRSLTVQVFPSALTTK